MKELIRLFMQIALLRRGPQDLPASALLLWISVAAYFGINFLVSCLMPPMEGWPAALAVDVVFTLVWYFVLLRVAGRSERILQTTTAVFGFQAVLSPLLVISDGLLTRSVKDPTWQLPVFLIWLILFTWLIAANTHVVKAALEWSNTACVILVILQIFAGWTVTAALFPPPPTAGPTS